MKLETIVNEKLSKVELGQKSKEQTLTLDNLLMAFDTTIFCKAALAAVKSIWPEFQTAK